MYSSGQLRQFFGHNVAEPRPDQPKENPRLFTWLDPDGIQGFYIF